jgi:PAS domain S-box-containing protein
MSTILSSEALLQQALRAAKVGLWDWDLNTNLVRYSAEWKRQLGYAEDEISNELKEWESRIHPDDSPRVKQRVGEYLRSPWPDYEEQFRVRRKDGSWRWMLMRADLARDEQGRPVRMVGSQLDITRLKLTEIELGRVNRALRLISGSNLTLVQLADEATVLERICRLAVEVGGYRMAWVGMAEQDERKTVRPVAQAGFEAGYLESAGVTWADEPRGRGPSGTAIRTGRPCIARNIPANPAFEPWREAAAQAGYESSVALPLRSEGRVFGNLSMYAAEVDAFNPAEVGILEELARDLAFGLTVIRTRAERDRAIGALKESQHKLEEAQRIAHVGHWERDLETDIITWSDEIHHIFGLPQEERRLSFPEFLELIDPGDRARIAESISEAVRNRRHYAVEYKLVRPDGAVRFVHSEGDMVQDSSGQALRAFGILQDITERKLAERTEEALRETQAALARVTRATTVGQLTASIAHEVNQPLGAVVTNAEACLRWLAGKSPNLREAREALQRIIRDGNRASEVVARIRSLLRHDKPTKDQFSLGEMIGETAALAQAEVQRRHVSLEIRLATGLPRVTADRVQLQQVLLNLMMNSLEALSEVTKGPRLLTVEAGMESPAAISVAVQDTGIGIDPRRINEVFEPFHTTKPGGLGLGLWISRAIIEAHGGRLRATPNEGPGVRFSFTLPVNGARVQ